MRQQIVSALQVSQSILVDLSMIMIWTVNSSPDFKFPHYFLKFFEIILSAPNVIGITVTFIFHNIFLTLW